MPVLPSIEIGSASTGGAASASVPGIHEADLGKTITVNGKIYRLFRANATLAAAANKVVVRTAAAANTVALAGASATLIAGVVPAGQTGSDGSTSLLAGDYFYAQVGGMATPLVTTNGLAAGTSLITDASAQGVTSGATFSATLVSQIYAVLHEASVTNSPANARLVNLV